MKIYHTSAEKNIIIEKFGDFPLQTTLCFSNEIYVMTAADEYHVHTLEIEEDEIIHVSQLEDIKSLVDIMNYFDVDEEAAQEMLNDDYDHQTTSGEEKWWLQHMQSVAAKNMGFLACEAEDEQGTVYLIEFLGKEKLLTLETN